ncbi:MAG: ParB/RepB/Spo0J family partition protein [Clostridiales bacterium]|nr:ParB/RepB/Spo0J family partition protein [Clostridiales bacterium]
MNANEMTGEDFDALCDNIGKSGLSSVPCCYRKENGRFVMISGHHRLRACKKLHYHTIGILYCDESELSKDEIIAIQLSHNSLHGQDNQSILKKLFEQIQSVDFKKFAHINIDDISPFSVNGIDIFAMKETFVFTVILYPNSFMCLDELYGDIREQAKKSDVIILADDVNEQLLLKLQKDIGSQYNIKSPTIAFSKLLELAKERLTQIQDEL